MVSRYVDLRGWTAQPVQRDTAALLLGVVANARWSRELVRIGGSASRVWGHPPPESEDTAVGEEFQSCCFGLPAWGRRVDRHLVPQLKLPAKSRRTSRAHDAAAWPSQARWLGATMDLKRIVEGTDTRAGKTFAIVIQLLIVLSLVSFSVETLPHLTDGHRRLLRIIEVATIAVFTAEYVARLAVADNRLRFVFSFYGLIDLFAILPFYLSVGLDLRAIRAIRLLRLIRIFKLSRFGLAGRRLRDAFVSVREELILFFCVTIILLYLAAMGYTISSTSGNPRCSGQCSTDCGGQSCR